MTIAVCVVTGSRADYGLLCSPMRHIAQAADLRLQVAVTGSHLSAAFGESWRDIERDGFTIDRRVDLRLEGDALRDVGAAFGRSIAGFTVAFDELAPDVVLVLGDRYEMLGATLAAALGGRRLVHLCGGDVTEGAVDDGFRHSITKLSHAHCVTNAESAARVIQMGEAPDSVFTTGNPALDLVADFEASPRADFAAAHGLDPSRPILLVSYHPTTLGRMEAGDEADILLEALQDLGSEAQILLTGSNADVGGQRIGRRFRAFAALAPGRSYVETLGRDGYFDALSHCAVLVGNSSSGFYEAPSFSVPTVNIGSRQSGRIPAESVRSCEPVAGAIRGEVLDALRRGKQPVRNPYGDGRSGPRVLDAIRHVAGMPAPIQKSFHRLG